MTWRNLFIHPLSEPLAIAWTGVTILAYWICFPIGFTEPWVLIIPATLHLRLVPHLIRGQWCWMLFLPFFILPCMGWNRGTFEYFFGEPRFRGTGLPGEEYHNLDPVYRVGQMTSGCIAFGGEHWTQAPHHYALLFWVNLFGWKSCSYQGYYPDRDECAAWIRTQGRQLHIRYDEGKFCFLSGQREWIFRDLPGHYFSKPPPEFTALAGRPDPGLWLISFDCPDGKVMYLLCDAEREKVFARYISRSR